MNEAKNELITIENAVFLGMRQSFDCMLQNVLKKMKNAGNDEGTVALRVKVTLAERPDEYGRACVMPQFAYDTSSEIRRKDKLEGVVMPDGELVLDEEARLYKLVPLPERQEKMDLSNKEDVTCL